MADYKRMVSYMYQYDNGIKKKNVGFARIELRNGQCKVTLHMQLLGQLDSIFPTYLIQRENDNIELIYLGDTTLKNQVMDSKLTCDADNVMDSGHTLSEMGGILLFLNDNVFFASEWDDQPIKANEVMDALKPKSTKQKKEAPKQEKLEKRFNETEELQNNDIAVADEAMVFSETERPVEIEVAEKAKMPEELYMDLQEELSIPKYKLPRGWKTVERLQTIDLTKVSTAASAKEKTENESYSNETIFHELKESDKVETESIESYLDPADQEIKDIVLEQSVSEYEPDKDIELESPIAKEIFEKYPRIYPFEDNEILLCVKIEPKDIGLLPKELWAMSNNSFLLHGYYCYHHIIFAKKKESCGCSYLLGIPGIYHNREQFMARMFGFDSFKTIRKREARMGDFGYWYLPVNL